MSEYMNIGSSPCEEDCASVGSEGYRERAKKECKAYIGQLVRMFGPPPEGCTLMTKGFPHDFGTYHEVCAIYNGEEGEQWAFKFEGNSPMTWDDEAKKELGL